ncbi:nucleotide-binding domain-containing protein [Heliocybe sulcata]|uniref:Nucleotide-binding domain-containing protein n=1 Tax=Heliocybe sulcata TaxID=5364 RepID=A0A5C3MJ62_9AGAM|nr:nucleotide-binding domain-containing protein [Heliocybe sulcata]
MPNVTVVGAGVFGLTIALSLPRHYNVTMVACDMPGDPDSLDWASPWADAGFGGGGTKPNDPEEMEMLKAAFRYYWTLSESHPESSVKKMQDVYFRDNVATDADLWWKDFMPDYRIMDPSELPPTSNAKIGITYTSPVLTLSIYLTYLTSLLHASPNVTFVRKTVSSLDELLYLSPDVIVNTTGVGAGTLSPVNNPLVEPVRGQTIVIRQPAIDHMTLQSGIDYCYVIPRGDGTAVIGRIKEPGDTADQEVDPEIRKDIAFRANQLDLRVPATVDALDVVRDIVSIRPGCKGGMRLEAEVLQLGADKMDVPVVHVYGAGGTGYALSPGVGRKVALLVDDFIMGDKFPVPRMVGKGTTAVASTVSEEKGRCKVM